MSDRFVIGKPIETTSPKRRLSGPSSSRQAWPIAGGSAQLIFKTFRHVSNPFWFVIFVSEERASEIIESKLQSPFSERSGGALKLKTE
jgi:hypothetical protein